MKIVRLPRSILGPLSGAILTAGVGLLCLVSNLGKPLERLSYDLPFPLRKNLATTEVAIVYLDEDAARALGQPLDSPWDRRIFAKLLDRLGTDATKLVCFDLIFSTPSADSVADSEFAAAMARHGGVILGGDYREHTEFDVQVSTVEKATPELRKVQAGWGLLIFRPIDPDGAVRQLSLGYEGFPSIGATAASLAGAKLPSPEPKRALIRWLNYYGPPADAFEGVSISAALRPDGVPPGFFRGRTIFVGGRYASGSLRTAKDEFGNPYSRWGRRFSPGVEIHATTFLNLLHGNWLRRFSPVAEYIIVLVIGLLFGGGLSFLRPHWATLATLISALGLFAAACASAWQENIWFPWLIPLAVQLPVALGWSVGRQYFVEQRRRVALRRAFACYLSPEMADRISNSNFDLRPGGVAVETTVVFTDLENFTTFSETLPIEDVSRILIAYFTQTTNCILQNKGTIIKYIGDAVMATWNTPIEDPEHARHAVIAAWALAEASKREVCGHTLRTRVGVHTGRAMAGNLGSPFRFDYTVIGDTVNFASRLEGINKYLGTQILLSEATANRLNGEFLTRPLGHFIVKGKKKTVSLHELLGPKAGLADNDLQAHWLSIFRSGLEAYGEGRLEAAAKFMRQTIEARQSGDGPAEFYLRKIAQIEQLGRPAQWTGSVALDEK